MMESNNYPESNGSRDNEEANDDKVKLMCSYGGRILPRPHDNQLTYVGGDTKILTVDRSIGYSSICNKLITLSSNHNICFKYQLPGEDLDALISVTNDEDLEHMINEYDRIHRSSAKPVRLRLFLFPFGSSAVESKAADQQWFADSLNAVRISSPASENPDFLFGFDKGDVAHQPEGSHCGSEDGNGNAVPNVSSSNAEMQRQMHMAATYDQQQQGIGIDPRAYYGEYYAPRYWQDQRHMTTGGYPMSVAGTDSPVYLIPSSTSVYPPAAAQVPSPAVATQGQGYYGMQRMVHPPEYYREQPVYGTMTQPQIQQPKVGAYQETIGMIRPQAELSYGQVGQVGVDATGRQVYYTTSQGGMGPTYQPVVAPADMRQGPGLTVNQEGKMVVNPNKIP